MFSTLLEFAILIFVQKQIFDRRIKKAVDALCRNKLLSRSASRYSGNRGSIKSSHRMSIKSINEKEDMRKDKDDTESSQTLISEKDALEKKSWEGIIGNGTMGNETNQSDKSTTISNNSTKRRDRSSQTSGNLTKDSLNYLYITMKIFLTAYNTFIELSHYI